MQSCQISIFPCNYLGLPLSNKKLRKSDLMQWIDKIVDPLPGWKAHLLNLAGRTAMVRFVLSAIPVYLLIALNVPKWVIKKIDKIRRAFLWTGRKETNRDICLVAWGGDQTYQSGRAWYSKPSGCWMGSPNTMALAEKKIDGCNLGPELRSLSILIHVHCSPSL